VYKTVGTPLVIKFPLNEDQDFDGGVQHSISEVRRIKRLSQIKELIPHLPKVHFHDRKSGVLVMDYYQPLSSDKAVELLGKVIRKLVSRIARVAMNDIHCDNVRKGRRGEVTFCDLGY
jgi:hypothetical protein